jgi:hypothetical protein
MRQEFLHMRSQGAPIAQDPVMDGLGGSRFPQQFCDDQRRAMLEYLLNLPAGDPNDAHGYAILQAQVGNADPYP